MADDNRLVNTQHRGAAIIFEIETVEVFILNFLTIYDSVQGFCKFQDHISCKAFTYEHVCMIQENVPSFYIANKFDLIICFQQWISGLRQYISFPFFFANIDQAHTWVFYSEDILRIQGSQSCKLVQV